MKASFLTKNIFTYLIGIVLILTSSCNKEEDEEILPDSNKLNGYWEAYEVWEDGESVFKNKTYTEFDDRVCNGQKAKYKWSIESLIFAIDSKKGTFMINEQSIESVGDVVSPFGQECRVVAPVDHMSVDEDLGDYIFDDRAKTLKLNIENEYVLLKVVSLTDEELVLEPINRKIKEEFKTFGLLEGLVKLRRLPQ